MTRELKRFQEFKGEKDRQEGRMREKDREEGRRIEKKGERGRRREKEGEGGRRREKKGEGGKGREKERGGERRGRKFTSCMFMLSMLRSYACAPPSKSLTSFYVRLRRGPPTRARS